MVKRKVSHDWISKLENPDHWMSYWFQLSLLENKIKPGEKIVEIGVGSKFLYNYLKTKGYDITGIDVDQNKDPDIVSDAVEFNPSSNFDHLLAFEVFEHLEYFEMETILKNLAEKVQKSIFISIPRNIRSGLSFHIKIKSFRRYFTLPIPKGKITDPHHVWELGYNGYNEKKIIKSLSNVGFRFVHKLKYLQWVFFQFDKK